MEEPADPAEGRLVTLSPTVILATSEECRLYFESPRLLSGSRLDVLLEQDEMTCQGKGDEACFCVSSKGLGEFNRWGNTRQEMFVHRDRTSW